AVSETVEGNTVEVATKLDIIKRWEVVDRDANGIATLRLSLAALRTEQKRPNGEVLLFDSEDLDSGTPELREQLSKHVGQTIAVVRVEPTGKVIDVKQGPANRFEAEPPFTVVLPKESAKPDQP